MNDLLLVWFGSTDLHHEPLPAFSARWFRSTPEFDASLRAQFGELLAQAEPGAGWLGAGGLLSAVLLCDQLPRNCFRGTTRAFATDARARSLARAALAAGHDREVGPSQRSFFYLPFMHSESREDQALSLELYMRLAAEGGMPDQVRFAQQHADVVNRFGRFPSRNAAMGRADTPDEAAWMAAGGMRWGQ